MAATKDLLLELEGIRLATLRAERCDRIETVVLALAAAVSAACMVIGLTHIYSSLAGLP
jgi:hypothetical protein